jgi:integrase
MPTLKMTDAAIQRIKVPAGERIDFFDASLPGFALRASGPTKGKPEGRKTWTLHYRFGGSQKRLTLEPQYPALGLAAARRKAGDALARLAEGSDPGAAKTEAKERAARAPDTLAAVVELYIRRGLEGRRKAPRYVEETRRNFTNHVLPRWGTRDIKSITRRDVIELLDAVMDGGSVKKGGDGKRRKLPGGPVSANRTLAGIRALFNFALARDIIAATPVARMQLPAEETPRDRTLTADEIRAIWAAAEGLEYPFGSFFRLALVTGQRRAEVAQMRWADVDLDERTWTLTASGTKSGRTHIVPLAPLAIEILRTLPRKSFTVDRVTKPSRFVFTTTGDISISGFSKAKPRLDQAIANARDGISLPAWTIHDLRRTAATEMGRLGIPEFIISKVLNHAAAGITAKVYNHYEYLKEKRHALECWAQYVDNLTRPSGGTVVALHDIRASA